MPVRGRPPGWGEAAVTASSVHRRDNRHAPRRVRRDPNEAAARGAGVALAWRDGDGERDGEDRQRFCHPAESARHLSGFRRR